MNTYMKGARVAIYNRCSTEELTQVRALEIQVAESLEIAQAKGWIVVEQFIEPKSGTESEHRYEYQKLFKSLSTMDYDIVMVKSQDRLMRSDLDWNLFVKELLICGKQLYFYIDNKFYHHETDYLLYGFTSKMNEGYSIELSKKIKNAHKRRQTNLAGLNICLPMFGWDKVATNQYVINEHEAKAIRDAFGMVRSGIGFRTIANVMYERGYRSKGTTGHRNHNGGMISPTWWRKNCIYDPRMHGEMILHKDEKNFFTKRRVPVPEEEWIHFENALPAIVTKEYQEETIAMLQARAYKAPNADRTLCGKHLYSNKIICKHCGCYYYRYKIQSGGGELLNWKCHRQNQFGRKACNNIVIEEVVLKELIENAFRTRYDKLFSGQSGILEKALLYMKQALNDNSVEKDLKGLEDKLQKQVKKKEVLFDKLLSETISDEDFQLFNSKLEKEIRELESQIKVVKAQMSSYIQYEKRLEDIKAMLNEGKIEQEAILQELHHIIESIEVECSGEITVSFDKEKFMGLLGLYHITNFIPEAEEDMWKLKVQYSREKKLDKKRRLTNEKVLNTFRQNPSITIAECAIMLGEKYSYIYTSVAQLRKAERLEYKQLTFDHEGIWIVKDKP